MLTIFAFSFPKSIAIMKCKKWRTHRYKAIKTVARRNGKGEYNTFIWNYYLKTAVLSQLGKSWNVWNQQHKMFISLSLTAQIYLGVLYYLPTTDDLMQLEYLKNEPKVYFFTSIKNGAFDCIVIVGRWFTSFNCVSETWLTYMCIVISVQ